MMKHLKSALVLTWFILSIALHAQEQIIGFSFDWDDNILFMPTKIILSNEKGEDVEVSTADYALIRNEVSKSGKYKKWSKPAYAYRYFRDGTKGENYFLNDIKQAVESGDTKWQAPSWPAFVVAMSDIKSAKQTSIITARGHSPWAVMQGLKYLKDKGYIKYLPDDKNIWGVGGPLFPSRFEEVFGYKVPEASAASPSVAKTQVMKEILSKIEALNLPESSRDVYSQDGTSKGKYHLWGFSDDDYENFSAAINELQKEVDSGKYKKIKISVFFTGKSHPKVKPHAVVLRPNAKPRTFFEENEWLQFFTQFQVPEVSQSYKQVNQKEVLPKAVSSGQK